MSECYISLYGDKAEAFEAVKDDLGPDGVDPSNPEVVMRLVELHQRSKNKESQGVAGGLTGME